MLLYSTILDINDNLTPDAFIDLVVRWNQGSPHSDNVIRDLHWNGEHNIRYGNDWLWLDIQEYRNRNIVAVRFEKKEADGDIWDTDYVMNFNEMRMAIQLDRSYTESAFILSLEFSTPHFVSMLIDEGYVKDDGDLPVLHKPIFITEDNAQTLVDIINGVREYRLPVVYVSKTFMNEDPVTLWKLTSKLKGVAHILVEESPRLNSLIREGCSDQNEYNGSIGVYYPNRALMHKRFFYRSYSGADDILLNKVVRNVIQYSNRQIIGALYTWSGVNNSLLRDRLQSQREERIAAESEKARAIQENQEISDLLESVDEEIKGYREQIDQLSRENDRLRAENTGLHEKLMSTDQEPLLFAGEEDDFYEGEVKDVLLAAIDDMLSHTVEGSRRETILKDVLGSNGYKRTGEEKAKALKAVLKGYKQLTPNMKRELENLGFIFDEEDNKHYKVYYYGDSRYRFTLAKTPSDHRSGANISSDIIKSVF